MQKVRIHLIWAAACCEVYLDHQPRVCRALQKMWKLPMERRADNHKPIRISMVALM